MFDQTIKTMFEMGIIVSACLFWVFVAVIIAAIFFDDEPDPKQVLRDEIDELKRDLYWSERLQKALETMEDSEESTWLVVNSDNIAGWRARWGCGQLSTDADSMVKGEVSGSDIICAIEGAITPWT